MSDKAIVFYINGEKREYKVKDIKHFSLLDFLREELKLTGSKKGCSEGDCGACTVVVGEFSPLKNRAVYKAVTSCIYPVFKIHGKHIITIEGLEENGQLNPIQQAFIEHHAIQCGFCTPGMIMSLFALLLNNPNPGESDISKALSGNLCRCTGYKSIKDACLSVSSKKFKKPDFIEKTEKHLKHQGKTVVFTPSIPNLALKEYASPFSVEDAVSLISLEDYLILNGGSDLGVGINKGINTYQKIIDLSEIPELKKIEEKDGRLSIGGAITFREFIEFAEKNPDLKNLKPYFEFIGSNQIRNTGTIAGNIANASPIADSAVFLLAADAKLTLASKNGKRKIPLSEFYFDYKKTALGKCELIEKIEFEIPKSKVSFIKTAKRKEVDIASVNSCVIVNLNKEKIDKASISFGGVYPYPIRIFKCEEFLKGKTLSIETIKHAAEICSQEVKPISDVRGSESFRRKLVYNQVLKHFANLLEGVLNEG